MKFTYIILAAILVCNLSFAKTKKVKNVKYRKTQEVSFDGQDIDGLARTPTGSYLVQKRGIDFLPLYKLKDRMNDKIEQSIEHLR